MSDKNPPVEDGLSVRDWFAAQALSGYVHMTPAVWTSDSAPVIAESIAARCYVIADALILERAK